MAKIFFSEIGFALSLLMSSGFLLFGTKCGLARGCIYWSAVARICVSAPLTFVPVASLFRVNIKVHPVGCLILYQICCTFQVQNLLGLFSLGRMLICKVTNITKNPSHGKANHNREKVTVHLTINPREIVGEMGSHIFNGLVVPAAVSGVEDHGYVMDVGLESLGIRAFLAKDKSVVQGEIGLPVIEEGQVLICAVESGGLTNKNPTARALQLNRNLTAVELSPKKISPANILPGAVLNVAVISKGPFGLRVQCGSVQVSD